MLLRLVIKMKDKDRFHPPFSRTVGIQREVSWVKPYKELRKWVKRRRVDGGEGYAVALAKGGAQGARVAQRQRLRGSSEEFNWFAQRPNIPRRLGFIIFLRNC